MFHKNKIWFPFAVLLAILLIGANESLSSAAIAVDAAYLGGEIIISERMSNEYSPAVAYNSVHDEYLVVWENVWPGGSHDIYAQRISRTGRLLSWFSVSINTNNQMTPSVAYDPDYDRYMVVWVYDVWGDGSDWDVYGRFIPWDGPDLSLTDFIICNWNSNQAHPIVTYAYAQAEYLVAWMNSAGGIPTYISARRVFADGSGFPPGDGFTISSGPENRDFPDVAYNLARNEYLVTWDVDKGGNNFDIYGIRLDGFGNALTGGDSGVIGEFAIAGWPDDEERPAVAACSEADQYLVAWQSDHGTGGTDNAIFGRYLNGDAVPGNVYQVADTTLPQTEVDVSCDAGGHKYLMAWQNEYTSLEYGIWARIAYPTEIMDPDFAVIAPGANADRQYPAIGGGRTSFLVAWEHERDGGTNLDIHGRLLRNAVFLPLVKK